MNKIALRGMAESEVQEHIKEIGGKPYSAKQVLSWLYSKLINNIDDMTNLSKSLREKIKEDFYICSLDLLKEEISVDGTRKYLFALEDGQKIESVLIPDEKRSTLCVSTQVGCKFNCSFCFTAKMGFSRDLTADEIVNQIIILKQNGHRITNVVFMGMGEPLDNYENVIKAVKIISSQWGLGISGSKITISTCGFIPGLKKLRKDKININLAISLNAAFDHIREKLMPINKKYPIKDLLNACWAIPMKPRKRITFEYVLIKGVNDSEKDARELASLMKREKCKINLLPFNKKPGSKIEYDAPDEKTVNKFHEYLISRNFSVFTRKQRGADISAACGQLTA